MPSLQLSSPAQSRATQPVQEGVACAWCSPCEAKTDAGAVPLPAETNRAWSCNCHSIHVSAHEQTRAEGVTARGHAALLAQGRGW